MVTPILDFDLDINCDGYSFQANNTISFVTMQDLIIDPESTTTVDMSSSYAEGTFASSSHANNAVPEPERRNISVTDTTTESKTDNHPFCEILPLETHNKSHPSKYVPETLNAAELANVEQTTSVRPCISAKLGDQFSNASISALESWLSRKAYPTVRDLETLRQLTGLSNTQIIDWFEDARRRLEVPSARPPTPNTYPDYIGARGVPLVAGRSATTGHMDPIQRWRHSPPEYEAASISAIAKAVSGMPSDIRFTDKGDMSNSYPARSISDGSSASSAALSKSSKGSSASAFSYESQNSPKRVQKTTGHKRRRVRAKRLLIRPKDILTQISHRFQCTFCTESFRTKHNWQRHEKSLHLSLEQWKCSPHGPTYRDDDGIEACVFCSQAEPTPMHLATHNHGVCQERQPEERTFYRKDHLHQHLKLVHNARFIASRMEQWKCENDEIRSRCGFCGIFMSSWADRVDHLAEHFKHGKSMTEWQGDWGFEAIVLDMVENSIPPYLIHYERNSPWPFTTTQGPVFSPGSAYELIRLELEYYSANRSNTSDQLPPDEELLYESCCIILGSEILSQDLDTTVLESSWLRDLLMSSDHIMKQARIRPMKSAAKSRITQLKIQGKRSIFEGCVMETQLLKFTKSSQIWGPTFNNDALQHEACNIINRMEELTPSSSDLFKTFLLRLIHQSTHWLNPFRERTNLPLTAASNQDPTCASAVILNTYSMSQGGGASSFEPEKTMRSYELQNSELTPTTTSYETPVLAVPVFLNDKNCYRRLARELSRFVTHTMSPRNPNCHLPTDEELQYQARWYMYDDDDPWNQTPADNPDWLEEFKRDVGLLPCSKP